MLQLPVFFTLQDNTKFDADTEVACGCRREILVCRAYSIILGGWQDSTEALPLIQFPSTKWEVHNFYTNRNILFRLFCIFFSPLCNCFLTQMKFLLFSSLKIYINKIVFLIKAVIQHILQASFISVHNSTGQNNLILLLIASINWLRHGLESFFCSLGSTVTGSPDVFTKFLVKRLAKF